jgi:choline dehydrogenase
MHDYVVVGAGSAGSVLARRLSDDPKCRVLLIEAGPPKHRSFVVQAPGLYSQIWRSKLDWEFYTTPQVHADGRRMFWPRGKILGGTSCLNASVYIRGHRDNYDAWRDQGNPGWGYADVLPYFKRSEDNVRGASEYHGAGGALRVSDQDLIKPVSKAFVEATSKRFGVPVTEDFNAKDQEGAGLYQVTVRSGRRASTAAEFLDPARRRKNLEVTTEALVTGIVIEGGRAQGVRCVVGGREQTFGAGQEVILCAGTVGSPQLLLLSGVGPADELRAAGVPVVHDLPGVGKNLQDHLLTSVVYETTSAGALALSLPRLARWALQFATTAGGPLRNGPVEAGAFLRSSPSAPRPDVQYHFVPWGVPMPNTDDKTERPVGHQFSILPGLIYPLSRGEIRLKSTNPRDAPLIDPAYFADPADLAHLVQGVRQSRDIASTAPLSRFVVKEIHPGPACMSDEAIRDKIRADVNTIFHPVGTCKMGSDGAAVVDAQLRVRGIGGLRVADASIMPEIIGGNTNAPVIMIAEKAADLVRGA